MPSSKAIIYYWQENKKINGSLFYAIEYHMMINTISSCDLIIVDINNADLNYIYSIIEEKYNTKINIIQCKRIKLNSLTLDKILVFDIKTFDKIKFFIKSKFLVYSNDTHDISNQQSNITFYGSYDYQKYDKYCILKLGLTFQKSVSNGDKAFVSGPSQRFLNHKKALIYKKNNTHYKNLFNEIDEVIYTHTGLDKNNRVIIEAFYHNKKCTFIEYNSQIHDSSHIRYNDCLNGELEKYILTSDDLLIQDFINDNYTK